VNRPPIIVTRAGDTGQSLAVALADAGEECLWLPAFEFGPAPDEPRVAELLGQLDRYNLAVFVSPAAVKATASRLGKPWPRGTAIAVVGAGTRRAIRAHISSASEATLFAPEVGDVESEQGGSEALWRALQPAIVQMSRVLILRAQQGREWLAERMAAAGARVDALAVYTRRPAPMSSAAQATVRRWQAAQRAAVLVVASSEAVDAVVEQLDALAGAAWTRSALALASHERIAQRLRAAGFNEVKLVAPEVDAIRKAIAK
jgi:uroporphyrinogen-III synthase